MKKKISLELFLAVMWRGFKQVLCAFFGFFSYKKKTPFWRVIWATLTVCVLLVTAMLAWSFYVEFCRKRIPYISEYSCQDLSANIYFYYPRCDKLGYTFDSRTGEHLADNISWVVASPEDSLAVFAKDKKRGYLNIYTGKEVIPPTYSKAWIFSDGVASVMQNDSIYFIDHSGKRIINRGYEYARSGDGYIFKNGYCVIQEGNKKGLIDKKGNLCLPFEYNDIYMEGHNYFSVCKDGKWGVINDSLQVVFPCEYKWCKISDENGIYLSMENNACKRYSYTGELIDNFVTTDVIELMYDSNTVDKEGNVVYLASHCLKYSVPFGCGLMSKDGKKITDPIFNSIEAIGPDLFICHYEDTYSSSGEGILLNSRGEIINK